MATSAILMRQTHRAGEKTFVDYSGTKPHYIDPTSGKVVEVKLGLTMDYTPDSVPMSDLIGVYRTTCETGNPTNCDNVETFWGLLNFWKSSFWANNPDAINYWSALGDVYGVAN